MTPSYHLWGFALTLTFAHSLIAQAPSQSTILSAMQALHDQTVWPVANSTPDDIESTFGPRWQTSTQQYDFHRGLDFDGIEGDDILAAADGIFWGYRNFTRGGRTVILRHDLASTINHNGRDYDHYFTYYMHLFDDGNGGNAGTDDIINGWVEGTTAVTAGQHIGEMGATGSSGGAPYADHLHFEVRFLANTSLDYQLDPDNTTTQHGFDPHIHPILLWSDDPADGFWPANYGQMIEQVGVTEDGEDILFRYTSDDETPALNETVFQVIDEQTLQVVKTHTLNFTTREGFDATSNEAIDDPDETLPYFTPTPFGDTAIAYTNEIIVPTEWLEGYGANHELKVSVANVWNDTEDLTISLVPEPRHATILLGLVALSFATVARRRAGS